MKMAIGFLIGVTLVTGIVVLAGGRASVMLGLGAGIALVSLGGILWLTGLRRVARFLSAFMDGLEGAKAATRTLAPVRAMRDRSGYVKPSSKQRDRILEDTLEEYLPDDVFTAPVVDRRVQ